MKIGIAGFSGSGKSTVFHWLTGAAPDPSKSQQGQVGKPEVPDERLDWLSAQFKPKKHTPAKMEFLDTPGLLATERRDNPRRLGILRDAGGLMVVLDGFSGSNLADELRRFREELLFADLEIVTNRIDKLHDLQKKARPAKQRDIDQAELELLQRVVAGLEKGLGASSLGLKDDEEKSIRSFQLLTLKREVVLVNIGDDRIGKPLPADLLALAPTALQAPVKLEKELDELSEEDRKMFMQDLNVTGFSRPEVLRAIFQEMGYVVFFTVGEDECRAWPIPKGSSAVESAGEIHTDLSRGFVRGEVVSYADFKRLGSMKEAKSRGVYRLEGKTYIVQDGDIMHILAST
jgi:ribosome-binding ATPase